MDSTLRAALQVALAQFLLYRQGDWDATKAVHDTAVEDDSAWTLNLALLYLLGKTWPAYYKTLNTDMPMEAVIAETIRNLATMEG